MNDDRYDSRQLYSDARRETNRFLLAIAPYIIGFVVLMGICGAVSFLTHSFIFQNVSSKIERGNQNADPNYARQITNDFVTTYADFEQTTQALKADTNTALTFIQTHGKDQSKWSLGDKQTYNHLYLVATGDYQNEQNLASHWASLVGNPDKAMYMPSSCTDSAGDTGACPQTLTISDTDPSTVLLQPAPLY